MKVKEYPEIGEKIYSRVHPSGLKIYVMPKQGFGKSYALFATNFGSVDNCFSENGERVNIPDGMAHFLEHKMFEEPNLNVFDKFSKLGASANAYTSFDMTAYLFSATSNFYESLDLLLSFVQSPYFTDENVSKEQGIIGQEIGMYNDDAAWRVFFNMLEGMYVNHPVKQDIAGSVESISAISKELLYRCHRNFYAPSNMALFAVGNVEPEKVMSVVNNCMSKREYNTNNIEILMPAEPDRIAASVKEQKLSVAKPLFALGFKEMPMENVVFADAAYMILLGMLFGKSSPLFERLYDEKLVDNNFAAGYSSGKGYALVEMSGESHDPYKVRELVLEHIEGTRRKGLDIDDFERVKRALYGKLLRKLNGIEGIAGGYVSTLFRGGDFLELPSVLNSVEFEDIQGLFETSVQKDKSVLSVINPV